MAQKLHSKLILLILVILSINAGTIIYFTMRDVGQAMLRAEKNAAQNIFHLVRLNIEEGYSNLLEGKIESINQKKELLKGYSEILRSGIDNFADSSAPKRRQAALYWIRNTAGTLAKGFVSGPENKVLYYPDSRLAGRDISGIRDIKGRSIPEIVKAPDYLPSGKFAVFSWDSREEGSKNEQFGYFISYEPWNWIVGTLVDVSDIEAEAREKLETLLNTLKKTFSKLHLAKTGSLFLFTKQKELLIAPHDSSLGREQLSPSLLARLMESAEDDTPLRIRLEGGDISFHTAYFKSLDWYVSALVPVDEIKQPARDLILRQSLIVSLVFLIGLILAVWFVRRISHPLQRLTAYVKTVPDEDFTSAEETEPPIRDLPEKYKDEVGSLAQSFLYMHSQLRQNIQKLMETTSTKERIQGELNVARDIQLDILPKIFPPFPQRNEFDLYAFIEPAKEVGGDFYDFYLLDQDHLCFSIGDVSDKGAPAALFMAITKTLIKSNAEIEMSPARIMKKVNNDLSRDNSSCMFVTLFTGILHIPSGLITYVNAGHNPPIVLNRDTGPYYLKNLSGPVAGAMEGMEYKEFQLQLRPGDGIFLYTDGVTEAMNESKELFSDERLIRSMQAQHRVQAGSIIETIAGEVRAFAGQASQSDDITMLILKYSGGSSGS